MDFGNTLVDYPLIDLESQLDFIRKFFVNYKMFGNPTLKYPYSLSELAVRLNTENSDHTVWPFVERVRSSAFFGNSLDFNDARDLENSICQALFAKAVRFDESIDFVVRIKALGLSTGIVSNLPWGTNSGIWQKEFVRHGFGPDLIDQIVCCVDVGYRKPHPAALKECISRLKCAPNEVIFVGDGLTSDIQAAIAAGCTPVWLDRRNSLSDFLGLRVEAMHGVLRILQPRPLATNVQYHKTYPSEKPLKPQK